MRRLGCIASLLLSCAAATARAEPGAGTIDDPVVVDAFPFIVKGTTAMGSGAIAAYDCAASTDESGPERIYRFSLTEDARVTAWLEGDGGGVDVDVHLLDALTLDGSTAQGCVARGNVITEAEMDAGEHYVVVDSYAGEAQAGAFVLHLEAIGDAWIDRPVAEGVRWRARRFANADGPQVVHELIVDTLRPELTIRAIAASGCQTVGAIGVLEGAVAGVNGGYFGPGCAPVSLLKEGGTLVQTNGTTRGAFGLTAEMAPLVEIVAAGQDWPPAHEAHGGGPVLVIAGAAQQGSAAWSAEGFVSPGFVGKNPRTFAGFDAAGATHLGTVDGRRDNASGMSLDELASFVASTEIGLGEGVNLDGGGSTTMWIAGATPNGVVNYPSDATQEDPTHPGSRPSSGGFFVFAPAYNHPPRFQTLPVEDARVGESYQYDADAIDLDVDDVIAYALVTAPEGMTIDASSGAVSFDPTSAAPPSAEVVIEAADGRGASAQQSYTLSIEGGMGSGEGGAGGGGGAGDEAAGDEGGGCGCRLSTTKTTPYALCFLLVLALWRKRR